MRPLSLDDLPKYTHWVERLLNAPTETLFEKTKSSIYREYETDKWAALWADVQRRRLSLDQIETLQFDGKEEIAISMRSELYAAAPIEARKALATLVADKVSEFHEPGLTVAELGAGTGAIIARIAKDRRFAGSEFAAADFSPSSIKLIDYVARAEGVSIRTGLFDFHSETNDFKLPADCTLVFSFTIAYIQGLDEKFWTRLAAMHPGRIVIAEPIYQYYGANSLLGLMRRRYYEANDYNREILPSIEEAERKGFIAVTGIEENVIGINPLCPVSLISLRLQ
jgi:predicted nicotinamide N-methyase